MTQMIYLTSDRFDSIAGATTPTIVLFAGRWSVLGNTVAAKLVKLDLSKVSIYQVDIDSSDGAQIAESVSIRMSPTVILFKAGVPLVRARDLTDEMMTYVK